MKPQNFIRWNDIKQIFTDSSYRGIVWNFGSLIVLTICGILLNIIIAWSYSPEILGEFNQVYAIYIIASQFAVIGIHLSVLKYIAEFNRDEIEIRGIFIAGLILTAILSFFTCFMLWMVHNFLGEFFQSPMIATGIIVSIPGLFFFSLNKVFLSALNGLSKIKEYAIFQAVRYLLLLIALCIFAWIKLSGELLPIIFSISETVLFITICLFNLEFFSKPNVNLVIIWLKKHLVFGGKGFLSNVLLDLNTRVDILILGYLADDRTVGIYSLAAMVLEGLYQIPIALRVNYSPIMVALLRDRQIEELSQLIRNGKLLINKIMIIVGFLSIAFFPLIILIINKQSYFMESWLLFTILMISLVIGSSYLPFGNIVLQAGFPGTYSIMIAIQVLINFVLNFILASWFGAVGSAIATGISIMIFSPLVKYFTRKTLSLSI